MTWRETLGWSGAGVQGRGKLEYPEKARRQAASSSTIPTCEDPGANPLGIDPGSPCYGIRKVFPCKSAIGSEASRVGLINYDPIAKVTPLYMGYQLAAFVGATVAVRLACSPPTKANRFQSPVGSLSDFRVWESCPTVPLVGGVFSGIFRFPHPYIPVLLHTHLSRPFWLSRPRSGERRSVMSASLAAVGIHGIPRRGADSHERIVPGRGEGDMGLRLRRGAAESAPAAARNTVKTVKGSQFIRHALDDSEPIADLQGNKQRVSYCGVCSNTGYSVGQQPMYEHLRLECTYT
ncbi:hypothetical protein PR048_007210 [Dryococelus australis]|uniref:Uncharacterized protein n=1 Tax=Dryococelus australis TaxID=614101 RepID=A0ABQ9ID16_9NEOP|nr:hypothetical protein PR048_007210 [Dryococelus australis]